MSTATPSASSNPVENRGANRRHLVLGQGLWLATMGIAIGVGGSLAVTRFLSSQLYGVGATDPVTFTAVVAVLRGEPVRNRDAWFHNRARVGGPRAIRSC